MLSLQINDINPNILSNVFNSINHGYDTRGYQKLQLPQVNTITHGINSFQYQALKLWNSLPDEIKIAENVNEFKNNIKNWKPRCSCGGCILCKLHLVQFLYLQMVMLIVTLLHPYHIILLFTCTFSSFAIICRLIVLLVFFVCKGATLNKIYCIVLFSCS